MLIKGLPTSSGFLTPITHACVLCKDTQDERVKIIIMHAPTATKDTNRKIGKTEFICICGSKNGSSSSLVNSGEVLGEVSNEQKALCMSC